MTQPFDPDEFHARNVRHHGEARANQARWTALGLLALRLFEWAGKRREQALYDLLDAIERVQVAAEDEARWSRIVDELARRVDEADRVRAKRSRLFTRIDFNAKPEPVEVEEGLRATDLDTDGGIEW